MKQKSFIIAIAVVSVILTALAIITVTHKSIPSIQNRKVVVLPSNKDYPFADLFPYQNLNTNVYAQYTQAKEITIFRPSNMNDAQAKLIVNTDLEKMSTSLEKLESLGVKILYKTLSKANIQDNIVGTGN